VGLQVHFFDVLKNAAAEQAGRNMANKISGRARIETEAEKLTEPIALKHGVRIYDVEYVKEGPEYYLNVYIDKDGGVTILDCETVSRELSDRLDEADLISDAYTLVVSSPGLGRALTKDRHLQNSLGERVEGKLFKPLADIGGREFEGVLTGWDAETVTLVIEPSTGSAGKKKKGKEEQTGTADGPRTVIVPRKEIAVIRLYLDI
jgi:ribosome maturation factor RimP